MFEFYDKNHTARNRYMTIGRYFRLQKKFEKKTFSHLSGDKKNEYERYKDFIKRAWIYVDENTADSVIENFVKEHGVVIVKPNKGEQGHGIFKIHGISDNKALSSLNLYRQKEGFLIEEVVENIEEIANINRSSLNTVRACTFTDKEGNLHFLGVVLRVGRDGNTVDNWGSGGIGYNFDLKTGVCDQPGLSKTGEKFIHHPGSGVKMVGFELPLWDELIKFVEEMSKVEPEARYVGWDIAITPKGLDLIEMNIPAGHDMFQSFNTPAWHKINKWL